MTIQLRTEPDSLADRVLKTFGKERAYILPVDAGRTLGPYATAVTRKESFWSCLTRSKSTPLPPHHMTRKQVEDMAHGKVD